MKMIDDGVMVDEVDDLNDMIHFVTAVSNRMAREWEEFQ